MTVIKGRGDSRGGCSAERQPAHCSGTRRPWFGPKRFGFGVCPQTWQGWLVTLAGSGALAAINWATSR